MAQKITMQCVEYEVLCMFLVVDMPPGNQRKNALSKVREIEIPMADWVGVEGWFDKKRKESVKN